MTDLFGNADPPPPARESADRERTKRLAARVAAGMHPVVPTPANPDHQCGNCAHLWRKRSGGFEGYKCDLLRSRFKDGPDVRVSWPACAWWVERA